MGSLCNRMASVSAAQWTHFKRPWTALQYYAIQEQATTRHAVQTRMKLRILFKNTSFNSYFFDFCLPIFNATFESKCSSSGRTSNGLGLHCSTMPSKSKPQLGMRFKLGRSLEFCSKIPYSTAIFLTFV